MESGVHRVRFERSTLVRRGSGTRLGFSTVDHPPSTNLNGDLILVQKLFAALLLNAHVRAAFNITDYCSGSQVLRGPMNKSKLASRAEGVPVKRNRDHGIRFYRRIFAVAATTRHGPLPSSFSPHRGSKRSGDEKERRPCLDGDLFSRRPQRRGRRRVSHGLEVAPTAFLPGPARRQQPLVPHHGVQVPIEVPARHLGGLGSVANAGKHNNVIKVAELGNIRGPQHPKVSCVRGGSGRGEGCIEYEAWC